MQNAENHPRPWALWRASSVSPCPSPKRAFLVRPSLGCHLCAFHDHVHTAHTNISTWRGCVCAAGGGELLWWEWKSSVWGGERKVHVRLTLAMLRCAGAWRARLLVRRISFFTLFSQSTGEPDNTTCESQIRRMSRCQHLCPCFWEKLSAVLKALLEKTSCSIIAIS